MLKFFQRNKDNVKTEVNQNTIETNLDANLDTANNQAKEHAEKKGFFSKLYKGLEKTRKQLFGGVTSFFTGKVTIDEEFWEELEAHLIQADVGIDLTREILSELSAEIKFKDSQNIDALKHCLKNKLAAILAPCEQKLDITRDLASDGPFVLLIVGVNGAGKTTTIGKLAAMYKSQGHSVMLAAGDTFRAAAIEQLTTWGERNNVPVVAQKTGADSASVIFDAYQSAKSKKMDILIADTAGRLHTQSHLMQELAKIKRVLEKQQAEKVLPQEVMLVIDASMGQNALQQARQFLETVKVTGIVITKLDGTAKGGIVFAVAKQLNIPIRYIGVGESIDDLQAFSSKDFVNALMGED